MRVYQKNAISVSISLNAKDCPSCGVVYATTDEFDQRSLDTGRTWYCPNGHPVVYIDTVQAKLDQANRDLLKQKARADQLAAQRDDERRNREATQRQLSATRGQVTKLRKHVQAGLCPYCRRHFTALERHICSKHKDMALEAETTGLPIGE